jgi:hypothetical protein
MGMKQRGWNGIFLKMLLYTHTQVTSILSTCIILHTAVKSRNVCRDGRLACLAGYVASV